MSLSRLTTLAIALSLLLIAASAAIAQQPSAAQRLPGTANALMTVEVAKILQSQLAKELGWQSKLVGGSAERPLAVPATAKRVTIAAGVHPAGMRTIWQTAVIELPNPPRFDPILRAQSGYLDRIDGKPAAWTPRDVLYIELAPNTLGVVRPGHRQFATRWITGKNLPDLPAYLKTAQAASAKADVLFAVDLDEAISATAIMHSFAMGRLPSLEKIDQGREKLMAALASVKGITLTLNVTNAIAAELAVDFDQDVSALGAEAKPLVIEVLEIADLYEPTADAWQFKAQGKRITGQGAMEPDALNRLLALLSPANVDDTNAIAGPVASGTPAPSPTPTPTDSPNAQAAASQRYYRAVSAILDTLVAKQSPKQGATWLVAKARVIEQLPILDVDPALVSWGNSVGDTLKRAAQELAIGQQRAGNAALTVQSPTGSTYAGEGSGMTVQDTPESRAAFRNAQQQRRQVAQTERGAAAERAFAILNEVLSTRGKIRAEMVQKYGVEF
jgi:hypothetical protein